MLRFFNVCCKGVWNGLPSGVVESRSLSSFKSALAEFLGDSLSTLICAVLCQVYFVVLRMVTMHILFSHF